MNPVISLIYYSGIFIGLFYWSTRMVHRYILLNKYKTIIEMFTYFLDKAYSVIYNDQLIVYTSSGINKSLPKEEIETIERNFIKLSIELMGKENEKTVRSFYGDESTMINNMLIFFRQKLESDTLAKLFSEKIT